MRPGDELSRWRPVKPEAGFGQPEGWRVVGEVAGYEGLTPADAHVYTTYGAALRRADELNIAEQYAAINAVPPS